MGVVVREAKVRLYSRRQRRKWRQEAMVKYRVGGINPVSWGKGGGDEWKRRIADKMYCLPPPRELLRD
jgi:hypothetical protein